MSSHRDKRRSEEGRPVSTGRVTGGRQRSLRLNLDEDRAITAAAACIHRLLDESPSGPQVAHLHDGGDVVMKVWTTDDVVALIKERIAMEPSVKQASGQLAPAVYVRVAALVLAKMLGVDVPTDPPAIHHRVPRRKKAVRCRSEGPSTRNISEVTCLKCLEQIEEDRKAGRVRR